MESPTSRTFAILQEWFYMVKGDMVLKVLTLHCDSMRLFAGGAIGAASHADLD
jgi:hypothetical protein